MPHDNARPRNNDKKFERGFFKFFNDKSPFRRKVIIGLTAFPMAVGGGLALGEEPDTRRGPQGAAQVEQYRSEVQQLAQESHTLVTEDNLATATPQERARFEGYQTRTIDLAYRLTLDPQISERDAADLSREFINQSNPEMLTFDAFHGINSVYAMSPFLNESRHNTIEGLTSIDDSLTTLDQARLVNGEANKRYFGDLAKGGVASTLFFLLLQAGMGSLLRQGTRRNEELEEDEKPTGKNKPSGPTNG